LELNRADITGSHPWLAQLIGGRTGRVVARINCLTGREQGEMPIARRAVISEGVEAGVARAITVKEGNGTAGPFSFRIQYR